MPEHFDVVVVGSGFGGSVMAHQVAQAGARVCVLERGKEYPPGAFPRSPATMKANFWDPSEGRHGLYDVWSFDGIDVLVSSGLGGGSLIYANVLLRKDENWFVREDGEYWPLQRQDLEPHYDAVEKLIGANPVPPHLRQNITKAREYAEAAGRAGLDHHWLPLAVTFPQPGQAEGEPILGQAANRYGRTRTTCRMCGECDLGCNYGSKNTLDLTVLSAAERAGAEVRTRCQVCTIQPLASGGYRVEYVVHEPDREGQRTDTKNLIPRAISCRVVVMAAGTLGSTYCCCATAASCPVWAPPWATGSRATATSSGCAWRRWGPRGHPGPCTPAADR